MPLDPSPKVFGIGFQKTGTSSLREALKILGYRVKDGDFKQFPAAVRRDRKRLMRALKHFDAAEDNPWPLLFRELDRWYPGSKFVLTVRDEETWVKSVSRHIGDLRSPMHEWIYGKGKGLPKKAPENAARVYKEHNRAVREHFRDRPEQLLEVDFTSGQGWEELCAFLGHELPKDPFPHFNDSNVSRKRKGFLPRPVKRAKKRSKYFFMRKYYEWRGYGE